MLLLLKKNFCRFLSINFPRGEDMVDDKGPLMLFVWNLTYLFAAVFYLIFYFLNASVSVSM
jgi:hypothetical protein